MSTQPHKPEQWARFVAKLRAYDQAERAAWGDIDDETLALYVSGECSPEERSRVELAIEQSPCVREAVSLAQSALAKFEAGDPMQEVSPPDLSRIAAIPIDPHSEVPQTKAVPTARRPTGRRQWLDTTALAAGLLLAVFGVYWIGRGGFARSGEVLLAKVEIEGGVLRGSGERSYRVVIECPRDGQATIVRLTPNQYIVWPRAGEPRITINAGERKTYGPLDPVDQQCALLVFVTERAAADTIRSVLAGDGATPVQIEFLTKQIEEALWKAGHRWAAIGQVTVEPPAEDRN